MFVRILHNTIHIEAHLYIYIYTRKISIYYILKSPVESTISFSMGGTGTPKQRSLPRMIALEHSERQTLPRPYWHKDKRHPMSCTMRCDAKTGGIHRWIRLIRCTGNSLFDGCGKFAGLQNQGECYIRRQPNSRSRLGVHNLERSSPIVCFVVRLLLVMVHCYQPFSTNVNHEHPSNFSRCQPAWTIIYHN